MAVAPLPPGSTLGVLGAGQLGRMFAQAAQRMGYRVVPFSPLEGEPAKQVCADSITGGYEDCESLDRLARMSAAVTLEFENIPAAAVERLERVVPVRPGSQVLYMTQNRVREKTFLARQGFPVTPFAPVARADELKGALAAIGMPAVLKSAGYGYDGKGQSRIDAAEEADAALSVVGDEGGILEQYVEFERELSVIGARAADGSFSSFGPIENYHRNHILDLSLVPARIPPAVATEAVELTRAVMEALEAVGLLCVELFLTDRGRLLINELAPRPHNSGHYTIDACATSQFEQQARMTAGLPLGSVEPLRPAAMANLLGDLWMDGEPDWARVLAVPGLRLHLYGKAEARPGRKMGHLTALADTVEEAMDKVVHAREMLKARAAC